MIFSHCPLVLGPRGTLGPGLPGQRTQTPWADCQGRPGTFGLYALRAPDAIIYLEG